MKYETRNFPSTIISMCKLHSFQLLKTHCAYRPKYVSWHVSVNTRQVLQYMHKAQGFRETY